MVSKTFDAITASDPKEFAKLLGPKPAYVPFETLREAFLNVESLSKASTQIAEKYNDTDTFNHCMRTYYFSLALLHDNFPSNTPGVAQISFEELNKRLYIGCILHDLSITEHPEALAHPAHAMSFELHTGVMAYEHLHAEYPSLDAVQVGDIVQGIMLHTISFDRGLHSATARLIQIGALFDVAGWDALYKGSFRSFWDQKTVNEIEAAFPRGAMTSGIGEFFKRELGNKPSCNLSHTPPAFFEAAKNNNGMSG